MLVIALAHTAGKQVRQDLHSGLFDCETLVFNLLYCFHKKRKVTILSKEIKQYCFNKYFYKSD